MQKYFYQENKKYFPNKYYLHDINNHKYHNKGSEIRKYLFFESNLKNPKLLKLEIRFQFFFINFISTSNINHVEKPISPTNPFN